MLRLLDYLMGGLALLALPLLVWWGIYQSPQSAVNLQARLEARAKAALTTGGADWASVSMEGQRAVLTGAAPSNDAVTEAARLVRRSSGAGGVIFGGVTLVESRADAAPPISPYVWRATKTGEGRIVLSGNVPSKSIQASLIEDARLVGRAAVDNEMKLAAGAPAGNFQGLARFALSQLAQLEEGEVTITDHRLVLRGEVADPELRTQIMAAVAGVAAPFRGEPVLSGDIRWRAELSGNVLTLSGTVADEDERRQLLAAAEAGFDGEIADRMTLGGPVAEGWLEGALAGLPAFTQFSSGEMAFDEAAGVFLFDGTASASTLYYLANDMARGAGRWKTVMGAEMSGFVPDVSADVSPAVAGDAVMPCEDQLQAALASGDIRFAGGGATIARESGPLLDKIVGIARNCDRDTGFEIVADSSVQASELADFLTAAGVPRDRVAAITYGPASGQGANQTVDTGGDMLRPLQIRIVERSGE
ncbi:MULTISPECIES: hypothetical protein [Hyphomonas]|nr:MULTISPECIES: hypothetical protein [Hyphomonas]